MIRAATGIPRLSMKGIMPKYALYLNNAMMPLWTTPLASACGLNYLPRGQSLLVCIMSQAWNQEDASVVCAKAIDFGMGRIDVFKTIERTLKHNEDIPVSEKNTPIDTNMLIFMTALIVKLVCDGNQVF